MADSLILKNHPTGTASRLVPMPANQSGDVHLVQWPDLAAEIEGLSAYVDELINRRSVDPGSILLLSPRRRIGYALRDRLADLGIDAHSFYNEEPLEEPDSQQAFVLLTLLADPGDRVSYRFWLGFGSQDWRKGQYATLRGAAEAANSSPREFLAAVVAGSATLTGVANIKKRHEALEAALAPLQGLAGDALVDAVFAPSADWAVGIRDAWASVAEADAEPSRVLELLRTELTHPEVPTPDAVRIMSLHKSKGLTAKVVIVTSCVQGLIPAVSDDASERQDVEREQRRLFYVALTRATDTLVLSSCNKVDRKTAFQIGMKVRPGRGPISFVASQFFRELRPHAPAARTGSDWASTGYT